MLFIPLYVTRIAMKYRLALLFIYHFIPILSKPVEFNRTQSAQTQDAYAMLFGKPQHYFWCRIRLPQRAIPFHANPSPTRNQKLFDIYLPITSANKAIRTNMPYFICNQKSARSFPKSQEKSEDIPV
jgi:hypothetical protein